MTTSAPSGAVEINDTYRAETKTNYVYNRDQLKTIIDKYKERKYIEDIEYI